jgi:ppGpp synthetase/RelA/SpoT-type nucleotidyltranferase
MAAREIEAKPTFRDYSAWRATTHSVTVDERLRNRYETVAEVIRREFGHSNLWQDCLESLREFDAEYQVAHNYPLLDPTQVPDLRVKPFASFLLKTYRKNILDNPAWPAAPPATGWLLPVACVALLNDVVRTRFVVKYLDGVEFLVDRFAALAQERGVDYRSDFEAREEGYYAAHAYVSQTYEVPAEKWDTEKMMGTVELQITTQVQELITRLPTQLLRGPSRHAARKLRKMAMGIPE